MKTLSAMVAVLAGMATAFGPIAATAQDALRDAVNEQQRQSDAANATDPADATDTSGATDATDATTDMATDTEADAPVLLTEAELDDLVAPVALYPDALLAQVLVAATYPLQIVEAERFLTASEKMSDAELGTELEGKTWDPSVLVLASGFPTVVQRMSEDLDWTDRLGRAMLGQDDDVLAAVQRKRAEAKEVGNLADNAAQTVATDDTGDISIAPADPKVVYVPTYDPQTVYTTRPTAQPYVAPIEQATSGGLQPNPLVTGALAFGAAFLVSQFFGNKHDDKNDDGWDDYWNRRQFDWRDRQFYPRPGWQQVDDRRDHSWGWERDRYWDPRARRWDRRGPIASRDYDDYRRDTLGWMVVPDPERRQPWVRGFRPSQQTMNERALRQAERQAAERREARLAAERRDDRRARQAEEQREARLAAERREARQKVAAERRRDAAAADREHAARQKAILERRAKIEADQRAQQQTDAKAKRDADARAKAQADRRAKAQADARAAKADADARAKAQADRRAKAQADAKAKAQAETKAKAQSDAKAKAQAERRAQAQADAKAKARAEQRAKAQADAKAKANADARAERRAKAQADAKAQAQADAKARARAEQRAKAQAAQAREANRAKRAEQQQQRKAKCRPNDEACLRKQ
ncbi:hypothetical protein HNP73_001401 [Amaricoccus macauensis]|uniref:DUF3300 domain-containing protein n=1 Tax=Amaricoccus macauensis TaxID=57001 RepID=A0A840SL43_9RHOB|nr:DUF3300 domain-containing protein [Amaricoccus macauensis]MBB5221480.1 hypothetical protein [Amaricoccus macauensis]